MAVVLQCIAVCCSVLQCVAVCCSVMPLNSEFFVQTSVNHGYVVTVCCSVLQRVAACCSVLQCVAVCQSWLCCTIQAYKILDLV